MTIVTESGGAAAGLGAHVAALLEGAAALPHDVTFEDLSEAAGMAALHVASGGTPAEGGLIAEARLCEGMAERLGKMAAAAKLAADAAKEKAAPAARAAAERARAAADAARDAAGHARERAGKSYADAKEGYKQRMVKAADEKMKAKGVSGQEASTMPGKA